MKIKVCVMGLGYVGLPLSIELSKHFPFIGFDISKARVSQLNRQIDINNEFKIKELKNIKNRVTSEYENLNNFNFFIITVPTPINKKLKPNLRPLNNCFKLLKRIQINNSIIVVESTVYPGLTEMLFKKYFPKANEVGLRIGYSPERINPGDKKNTLKSISKIISAQDKATLLKIRKVYGKITRNLIQSNSIQEAEFAKAIENTQRDINIAFVNEIAAFSQKINCNIFHVLELAKTKWNFLDFKPGMVGGHCIGVDPYYLKDLAKRKNFKTKMIISGRETNEKVFRVLGKKILDNSKENHKILFLGLTFKPNISDIRNSGSIKVIKMISRYRNNIYYEDKYVDLKAVEKIVKIRKHNKNIKYDLIIYCIKHSYLDKFIAEVSKINTTKNTKFISMILGKNHFFKNFIYGY